MSAADSETIPEDHAVWSILTGELVSALLHELPPRNDSPALRRLYDIIVQHPSNLAVRGIDVPLTSTKRKTREDNSGDGTGDGRKSKKGRSWEMDGVAPRPTPPASAILSTLGSATSTKSLPKVVKFVRALVSRESNLEKFKEGDYTFEATLKMCEINNNNRALRDFYHMIGYIRLAFHLDRIRETEARGTLQRLGYDSDDVYEWRTRGTRLILLMTAGTPYILLIIASLHLYGKTFDRKRMSGEHIMSLAANIRQSSDPGFASIVEHSIIPLIVNMHRFQPLADALSFRIFPPDLPESFVLRFDKFQDVEQQLKRFKTGVFYLPERSRAWDILLDLPPSLPSPSVLSSSFKPSPSGDLSLSVVENNLAVFLIPYPQLRKAFTIKLPFALRTVKHPKLSPTKSIWTDKQRSEISKVVKQATSFVELERLINSSFKDGACLENKFIQIPHKFLANKTLKFMDTEERCVTLLCGEALDYMRERIRPFIDTLKSILGEHEFQYRDSSKSEGYISTTLDIFNRFVEKGHGSPANIHPYFLKKSNTDKVNHGQRIPYLCKTARDSPDQYHALMDALKDICKVVNDVLFKYLPDEHAELSIFCEIIPLNERPATYPFPGCIVNIHVTTIAHRDGCDKTLCIVIPFGEFEDGKIVLFELGLVVEMFEGMILAFPSYDITHFNFPFRGFRGSIVLHADKEIDSWIKDRNGWDSHMAV